jgi:hypothetical protein
VATVTGRTVNSILPQCDTPGVATASPGSPDGLSRAAAEAAWHAVTPAIAGTPHVRVSKDGGRTYPARHARPLRAEPPDQPVTVPVYNPGSGTGRMLALDLDPGRADRDVNDGAVQHRHEHRAARVRAQAEALAELVARCGGQVLADVSPSGGRHVYVLFVAPLPWLELRDVARALALRFPSIDTAPMSSLGGQISPPGSRHKSGGWRMLSVPLEDARAAVEHPTGPEVWAALLGELAAELRRIDLGPACTTLADEAEMDDMGVPWLPRLGGGAPLGADLERVARSGRWDRSRYPGRSEARMAVLGAAAARGWRLAEVQSAIRGPLPQQEQLTSMTGPCGWHTTQCRASVTRSPSRCSQTMARSSRCCTASCLVAGSRPQVGQARGARAAAGRVRALAAGSLMRAWIECGSVASGPAGAADRALLPGWRRPPDGSRCR